MTEREVARAWYARVVWIQYGHYKAALIFNKKHRLMGGLTVLLTAAVGTSVFASMAQKTNLMVVTGALSILATLAAALQTFLSYSERADKHRIAGARYGSVGRQLEVLLARQHDPVELQDVKEKLDALSQECPHIPDYVNKQMQKDPPRGLNFDER